MEALEAVAPLIDRRPTPNVRHEKNPEHDILFISNIIESAKQCGNAYSIAFDAAFKRIEHALEENPSAATALTSQLLVSSKGNPCAEAWFVTGLSSELAHIVYDKKNASAFQQLKALAGSITKHSEASDIYGTIESGAKKSVFVAMPSKSAEEQPTFAVIHLYKSLQRKLCGKIYTLFHQDSSPNTVGNIEIISEDFRGNAYALLAQAKARGTASEKIEHVKQIVDMARELKNNPQGLQKIEPLRNALNKEISHIRTVNL